jgi:WD40 repeat protein
MRLSKWKAVAAAAAVLSAGLAVAVVAVALRRAPEAAPPAAPRAENGEAPESPEPDDPLPPGAVARFGTVRLRPAAAALAVTPDGQVVITAGGNTVREWDADTGAAGAIRRLPGPAATLTTLSPDGQTVALWGTDGLTVWDAARGERLHRLPLPDGSMLTRIAFTPDGRALAMAEYAGAGGPIRLWDLADGRGRLLAELAGAVTALAVAPDGKRLAAAAHTGDRTIRCWDTADGRERWRATAEADCLAFSPDCRTLASAALGGPTVNLWDAETGRPTARRGPTAAPGVESLRFGPDGVLAVGTPHGVLLWDVDEERERRRLPARGDLFAFSPDGRTLTGLVEHALQRWDLATGDALYPDTRSLGHLAPVEAVAYSPDGTLLATAAFDGDVRVWDVASRTTRRILPGFRRSGWAWLGFLPDGATLVTAGNDAPVWLWDVRTGAEVRRLPPDAVAGAPPPWPHNFHVSADGKTVITVVRDSDPTGRAATLGVGKTGTLTAWDVATGGRRWRRTATDPRHSDVFSPDGRWIASEGGLVSDAETGERRLTLRADHRIGISAGDAFAFSPDGALIAGVLCETVTDGLHRRTESRGIQVWELDTGAPVARVPTTEYCRFGFAPDGLTLATVGPDGIGVWDAVSGRELYRRPAPDPPTPYGSPFAVAPDGRRLAAAAADTNVVVWDLSPAFRGDEPPRVTAAEADALWADLAGTDAAKAWAAVGRLAARPVEAVPLLRDRLRPAAPLPAGRLNRWIADLDDDDAAVREAASRELSAVARQVGPALREALTGDLSLEQRQRIEAVLKNEHLLPPGDILRGVRGVRALERIGGPDARGVLEALAAGDPAAPQTQEAAGALARRAAHP